MRIRILLTAVVILGLCGAVYWHYRKPAPLAEADFLLLGEIANQTGEPDFDGSLREALRVALLQSPHLNLISDEKIRATLPSIGQSEHQTLTPELSKALCGRLTAKAYLTGLIKRDGSGYAVSLEVHQCPAEERLIQVHFDAPQADQVIGRLGKAATELRTDLGESAADLKTFNLRLEHATTPIPAALKAYQQARAAVREKGDLYAVPFYQKAIDLDARFAMAHSGLAVSYFNLSQLAQASEHIRQAYEASDRQTFREHLNITTLYYDMALGDVEKAIEGYKEYIRVYPRDDVALGNLSSEFFAVGDYEQAASYAEQALKIDPDSAAWYENYSTALLALSRTDEAEAVFKDAFSRGLDDPSLHLNLYTLAFMKADASRMQEQLAWAENKKGGDDSMLAAQADTEAFYGRLKKAGEFTRRAVLAAQSADLKESAALWAAQSGLREAMFGHTAEAQESAQEALKLKSDSKDVNALAALIFALTGDPRAQSIADDLRAQYFPIPPCRKPGSRSCAPH
jgi:tetratricopeptide (TPR) repeat protein